MRKAGRLAEASKLTLSILASAELKGDKVVFQGDGKTGHSRQSGQWALSLLIFYPFCEQACNVEVEVEVENKADHGRTARLSAYRRKQQSVATSLFRPKDEMTTIGYLLICRLRITVQS